MAARQRTPLMVHRDVTGLTSNSSAGEVTSTSSRELPKGEGTCPMVALTRDFHVFASRVTADFSAVFFSIWYITQTWYVRAFVGPLIRHSIPSLSCLILRSLTAAIH
jgi:hypothetical protein